MLIHWHENIDKCVYSMGTVQCKEIENDAKIKICRLNLHLE